MVVVVQVALVQRAGLVVVWAEHVVAAVLLIVIDPPRATVPPPDSPVPALTVTPGISVDVAPESLPSERVVKIGT